MLKLLYQRYFIHEIIQQGPQIELTFFLVVEYTDYTQYTDYKMVHLKFIFRTKTMFDEQANSVTDMLI